MASTAAMPEASRHPQFTNGHDTLPGHETSNGHHYSDGIATTKPHQSTVSQVFHPTLGKIANPGPLGLISFALTTFVLGLYQCGAGLPGSDPFGTVGPFQVVFGLAVFYGGAAQFVAGIMEFRLGNTFGTTVHCSYGAFWLSFAMLLVPSLGIQDAYAGDERAYHYAVGIYLILWSFLTFIFLVGALRTNIAIITVFLFLALAYLFLAIAQFTVTSSRTSAIRVNRAGGVFAIFSALAAFYAGSAGIMTRDTTYFTLPLGEFSHSPKTSRRGNPV